MCRLRFAFAVAGMALLAIAPRLDAAPPPSFLAHAGPDQRPIAAPKTAPLFGQQEQPALAFGAGMYFAVWRDKSTSGQSTIQGARLNLDGSAKDSTPIVLGTATTGAQLAPAVAFDGTRFLIAWSVNSATIKLAYVDAMGVVGATAPTIANASGQAAFAGGGGKVLLVFVLNGTMVLPNKIMGQALDDTGLIGSAFQIASGLNIVLPTVAGSGDEYFVAWQDTTTISQINGARVTLASTPSVTPIAGTLDSSAVTRHISPTCAFDGARFLVAWRAVNANEIHARTLDLAGILTADVAIGVSPVGHAFLRPQAAAIDGRFVVVWEDQSGFSSTLSGVRVDPTLGTSGSVTAVSNYAATAVPLLGDVDGRPSQLASEGPGAGTRGRLAWVRRTLVNPSDHDVVTTPVEMGALAATSPGETVTVPAPQRSVAMASNGAGYLAVWEDSRSTTADAQRGTDVMAQRFDGTGAPVGSPFAVVAVQGLQRYRAVAALPGGDYLVAWVDARNYLTTPYFAPSTVVTVFGQIYMTRIGADGTVRDPGGVLVEDFVSVREPRDRFPSIAADPLHRTWLLTWDSDRYPGGGNDLLRQDNYVGAVVVAESGAIGLINQIQLASPRMCGRGAAFASGRYLLAIEAGCVRETDHTLHTPDLPPPFIDVVGVWLDATGVPDTRAASLVTLPAKPKTFRMAPTIAATPTGQLALVWEEYPQDPLATDGSSPDKLGSLKGALVDPVTSVVTVKDLIAPSFSPHWPRLVGTPTGLFLSYVDETGGADFRAHGLRLFSDLRPDPSDIDPAGTAGSVPAVSTLPLQHEYADNPRDFCDPIPAAIASDSDGRVLFAYTAEEPVAIGRLHTRLLGGKHQGDACTPAGVGGCGDGRCERDAEHANAGFCCAVDCSGPCQKCTVDGCVAAPTADGACGMVTCGALSTDCRAFDDAPAACLGFNQCASSNDLSSCTLSHAINEGGGCKLPGCSTSAACQGGACVCPGDATAYGARRVLPPSCTAVPGQARSTSGFAGALLCVLGLGLLRRRRALVGLFGLLAITLTPGCADDGALAIDLEFEDGSLQETAIVRLVVKRAGGFPEATPFRDEARDETVRNVDLDGDGTREIVADLGPTFSFKRRTSYLKLTSSGPTTSSVTVSAQAIDRFGNPISATTEVVSTLPGGKVTLSLKQCQLADCSGRREVMLANPLALDPGGASIAALAARASTADVPGIVAAGLPTADGMDPMAPNRGRVALATPSTTGDTLVLGSSVNGAAAGDLFGASIALGDLDGDGNEDLVVGAPGASTAAGYGAGRVYVFTSLSASSLSGVLLSGSLPATIKVFDGTSAGAHLGAALALADLDGDGLLEIITGAPAGDAADGKGALHVLSMKSGGLTVLASASGAAGAHLGRQLATVGGTVAAAAPGENATYLWRGGELLGGSAPRVWRSTGGGGLGSAVALCDVGADGRLDAIASAPAGAGMIYSLAIPDAAGTLSDADVQHTILPGQAALAGQGHLGATLARVRTRYGDSLWTTEGDHGYLITASAIAAAGKPLDPTVASAVAMTIQGAPAVVRLTAGAGADLLLAASGLELLVGDSTGKLYVYSYGGVL